MAPTFSTAAPVLATSMAAPAATNQQRIVYDQVPGSLWYKY